jgi:hypothetical protein
MSSILSPISFILGATQILWTDIVLLVIGVGALGVLGIFIWRLADKLIKRLGREGFDPSSAGYDDTLGVESTIPSLDGTEGGWRFTKSLSLLVVLVIFLIPFVTISVNLSQGLSSFSKPDSLKVLNKKDSAALKAGIKRNWRIFRTP